MILTVVIRNEYHNHVGLQCQNEYVPFSFRTVHIELTKEQVEQIGVTHDKDQMKSEFIHRVWIEDKA